MTVDRRSAAAHVFVRPDDLLGDALLPVDEAMRHHLVRVLRLRDGESVSVSDGQGGWRLTVARRVGDELGLEPTTDVVREVEPALPFTLATAIPKGDRIDWLVQKATELGVDRIVLLDCQRSVVRWPTNRIDKQMARLTRISEEAARQSRRTRLVEIAPPTPALDVLPHSAVGEPGGRAVTCDDRYVAVGPEGGWTDAELAVSTDRVSLGANVLRTETAALAAAALCVVRYH